jgi:hypothetical protein
MKKREFLLEFLKFHYKLNPFRKQETNEKDIEDFLAELPADTEVKNLSSNTMLSDSLVAYQKWCYEHPEYDQVTETPKVELYLKATNVR